MYEHMKLSDSDADGRLGFDEFCVLMVSVGGERKKIDSSGAGIDMLIENGLSIGGRKADCYTETLFRERVL